MPHGRGAFSGARKPLINGNNNSKRGNAPNAPPLCARTAGHFCEEAAPSVSDRLRQLASRVERLAVSGRTDPEEIATEKQLIGRALRRLAKEADQ